MAFTSDMSVGNSAEGFCLQQSSVDCSRSHFWSFRLMPPLSWWWFSPEFMMHCIWPHTYKSPRRTHIGIVYCVSKRLAEYSSETHPVGEKNKLLGGGMSDKSRFAFMAAGRQCCHTTCLCFVYVLAKLSVLQMDVSDVLEKLRKVLLFCFLLLLRILVANVIPGPHGYFPLPLPVRLSYRLQVISVSQQWWWNPNFIRHMKTRRRNPKYESALILRKHMLEPTAWI